MKNIKDYIGKQVAIHCETEEEAKQIVKLCFENGLKWYEGNINKTHFEDCKNETCYNINNSTLYYGDLDYYTDNNYEIIKASEFLEDTQKEFLELCFRCPICKTDFKKEEKAQECYNRCGEAEIKSKYGNIQWIEKYLLNNKVVREDISE